MRWVGHVADMAEERKVYKVLERDHLEDQGVDGKMGSEWILGRSVVGVWLRIGTSGGLL
jgi:hypothetical protein